MAAVVIRLRPVYTKRQHQHCDDTNDIVLIENNGVAPEWGWDQFLSNSIDFNENSIASIIAELSQCLV